MKKCLEGPELLIIAFILWKQVFTFQRYVFSLFHHARLTNTRHTESYVEHYSNMYRHCNAGRGAPLTHSNQPNLAKNIPASQSVIYKFNEVGLEKSNKQTNNDKIRASILKLSTVVRVNHFKRQRFTVASQTNNRMRL